LQLVTSQAEIGQQTLDLDVSARQQASIKTSGSKIQSKNHENNAVQHAKEQQYLYLCRSRHDRVLLISTEPDRGATGRNIVYNTCNLSATELVSVTCAASIQSPARPAPV
jgi:hypothetical protein